MDRWGWCVTSVGVGGVIPVGVINKRIEPKRKKETHLVEVITDQ